MIATSTPENWHEIKDIFYAAMQLEPEAREQFLNDSCHGDDSLRSEVEAMISSSEAAGSFMNSPAVAQMHPVINDPGKRLKVGKEFGRYKILRRLGAGAMGEVYLARDQRLERRLALKILPTEFAGDSERLRRFVVEAKSASALNHPNILTIYETGEVEGVNYIASEFVEGKTLADLQSREKLDLKTALDYAAQIADALRAAHGANIVHRDIKPDNVMIRPDGLVKLVDFGIAKLSEPTQRDDICDSDRSEAATAIRSQTDPGMIVGTPNYMSPEQARADPVDARSDIFSFGLVFYEMLTGTRAFEGKSAMDVISAILQKEPVPISRLVSDVPQEINRILSKTLRKEVDERYQTAKDLLVDLKSARREVGLESRSSHIKPTPNPSGEHANETDSGTPVKTSLTENVAKQIKNRKLAAIVALSLLAICVVALIYFTRGTVSNKFAGGEAINVLAVLPLKSLDTNENYLGLGIADAVIRRINQTGKLIVRPTSSVRRYLAEETDALDAAKQLNADVVLEGSLQRADDRLRVSVNLLRTSDGLSLWSDKFDMQMADIFTIQDMMAQKVASRLQLELDPAEQARLTKRFTSNSIAYEYYLKGVYAFDQRVSLGVQGKETTIDFLKQAIEADPNFALAHAQLAYAYATKAVFIKPTEPIWVERAKDEINRAEAIDSQLAETHLARHQLLLGESEGYQGQAAAREVLLAQQLNPNVGHGELAFIYLHLGLEDLGAREIERAFEVDPTSEFAKAMTFLMFEVSCKYDEYAAHRNLYHDDLLEAWYFMGNGRLDEAQRAIEEWSAKKPDDINLPYKKALLLALKGDFRRAEGGIPDILSQHPVKDPLYHHAAYEIARIYALEGRSDEAVKWLRETAATGFPCYPLFERDAYLNRIRQSPNFLQFMKEMKEQNGVYRRDFASTP